MKMHGHVGVEVVVGIDNYSYSHLFLGAGGGQHATGDGDLDHYAVPFTLKESNTERDANRV